MDGEAILGLLLGGIFLMTPIVWILTKHQQKMATIMRQDQTQGNSVEIQRELASLREIVHQQTIAIDNISRRELPNAGSQERCTGV
ncbi:MAG: hypothetical protein H7Y17_14070 [Chlorobia bacterium]|nr:hypothetical protein [Fimbriimonadaceae bacterium]